MPAKKNAVTVNEPQLYIVGERYRWLTYREEGEEEDPIQLRVKVRKNLINDELESLTVHRDEDDTSPVLVTELAEVMAPFVVDWNIAVRDQAGEIVKPDPPAVAGGEQINRFVPPRIIEQMYIDFRLRSTGLVSSKPSAPLKSTDATSGATNSSEAA